MDKATERVKFDAVTGTVIVECVSPDGGTFDIQVDLDATEAVVQAFRDARPEPSLGLEDTGVYFVRDLELVHATDRLLLDVRLDDGRKARFVLPQSACSEDAIRELSEDLPCLSTNRQSTRSR